MNAQGVKYARAPQAASSRGHFGIVRLLLDHGADMNAEGGVWQCAASHIVDGLESHRPIAAPEGGECECERRMAWQRAESSKSFRTRQDRAPTARKRCFASSLMRKLAIIARARKATPKSKDDEPDDNVGAEEDEHSADDGLEEERGVESVSYRRYVMISVSVLVISFSHLTRIFVVPRAEDGCRWGPCMLSLLVIR